jgi:hypothetical protein
LRNEVRSRVTCSAHTADMTCDHSGKR